MINQDDVSKDENGGRSRRGHGTVNGVLKTSSGKKMVLVVIGIALIIGLTAYFV